MITQDLVSPSMLKDLPMDILRLITRWCGPHTLLHLACRRTRALMNVPLRLTAGMLSSSSDVLRWALNKGWRPLPSLPFVQNVLSGELSISSLRIVLEERDCVMNMRAHGHNVAHGMMYAIVNRYAYEGELVALQYMYKCGLVKRLRRAHRAPAHYGVDPYENAVIRDHVDVLAWLCEHRNDLFPLPEGICELAAGRARFDMLMILVRAGATVTVRVCAEAAEAGCMEILQWWLDSGYAWSASIAEGAAYGNHLHILQWLNTQGCPLDVTVYEAAAAIGDVQVLGWLFTQGGAPDIDSMYYHAGRAYVEGGERTVDWLLALGHPWSPLTCAGAAEMDLLDALRKLRARGCPWDSRTYEYAISCEWPDDTNSMLEYLWEHDCPWTEDLWVHAVCHGNEAALDWLGDELLAVPGLVQRAADLGKEPNMLWLSHNGYAG